MRKNPLPKNLVGTKWTAAGREPVLGWRHFVVEEARKSGQAVAGASSSAPTPTPTTTFVRLRASCDPTARLWVSALLLRDRARWAAGWLRMDDVVLARVDGGGGGEDEVQEGGQESGRDDGGKEDDDGDAAASSTSTAKAKRRGGRGRRGGNSGNTNNSKIVMRGSVGTGAPCRKCSGTGWRPCTGCKGEGRSDLIVL